MAATSISYLDSDKIVDTVGVLSRRIKERFPSAGLNTVCGQLLEVSRQAKLRSQVIARPIVWVRVASGLIIAAITGAFFYTVAVIIHELEGGQHPGASDIVQMLEAAFNSLLLVGATVLFLVTLESRIKRRRALQALHELRVIAHIIDMHQLTKDPERMHVQGPDTKSSPKRTMTNFELNRYLDYCSEMLSLSGKIAALYVQDFPDADVVAAVNDIEDLTSGLSRKIWQKIMILDEQGEPKPT